MLLIAVNFINMLYYVYIYGNIQLMMQRSSLMNKSTDAEEEVGIEEMGRIGPDRLLIKEPSN